MEFLKAHYEKIVLSVVLIGLAAAAALMPIRVAKERENEDIRRRDVLPPKVKPLEPLDLSTNTASLSRLERPAKLKFSGEHNVFNPVRWQKRPDGGVLKGTDAGINALQVTSINPLHLRLEFDEVTGDSANPGYYISVLNEVVSPRATPRIARLKQKNNVFMIEAVRGDPMNPSELDILLEEERTPVTISKAKPFQRIVGYSADLRYEPENRTWKNQKKDDEVSFAGETYKIVAITPTEVVLSAKSNKKQTTKEYRPSDQ